MYIPIAVMVLIIGILVEAFIAGRKMSKKEEQYKKLSAAISMGGIFGSLLNTKLCNEKLAIILVENTAFTIPDDILFKALK